MKQKHLIFTIAILIIAIGISIPLNTKTIEFEAILDEDGIMNVVYIDGYLRIYGEGESNYIETTLDRADVFKFYASNSDTDNLKAPKIEIKYMDWFIGLRNIKEDEVIEFIKDNYFEQEEIKIYYNWKKIRFKNDMSVETLET